MIRDFGLLIPVLGAGYLLGSIPTARIICGLFFKVDITKVGSGNPGMTNVWRSLGWKPALPVALLDAGKGFLAAGLASMWTHSLTWALIAGIAAVLGHSFSFFARFKGGKSVLTGFGVFLYLTPLASISSLALCVLVLALSRIMSLGSLAAAVSLPVFVFIESHWHGEKGATAVFWTALTIGAFVIFRHRANLVRLWQGTEPRFQGRAT